MYAVVAASWVFVVAVAHSESSSSSSGSSGSGSSSIGRRRIKTTRERPVKIEYVQNRETQQSVWTVTYFATSLRKYAEKAKEGRYTFYDIVWLEFWWWWWSNLHNPFPCSVLQSRSNRGTLEVPIVLTPYTLSRSKTAPARAYTLSTVWIYRKILGVCVFCHFTLSLSSILLNIFTTLNLLHSSAIHSKLFSL